MFAITEAEAAVIRAAFEQNGEQGPPINPLAALESHPCQRGSAVVEAAAKK